MDQTLRGLVQERLMTAGLDDDARVYVLCALESRDTLEEVLGASGAKAHDDASGAETAGREKAGPEKQSAGGRAGGEKQAAGAATPQRDPVGAYLASITVENFRGIGPAARVELDPGPGFTLIVGRNGSGKSSFAEGLEVLFTGDSTRWAGRSKVWSDGWRCLHSSSDAGTSITADLLIEGAGRARVSRTWEPGAGFDASTTQLQRRGEKAQPMSALGWDQAISLHRPFLSYNELGSMLQEGPSTLFDALSSLLGLEALVDAQEALRQTRLSRERDRKDVAQRLPSLLDELNAIDDDRAQLVAQAIGGRSWDLETAEGVVSGTGEQDESRIDVLRRLSAIRVPDEAEVRSAVTTLRAAAADVERVAGTDAGRARATAGLLEAALAHHAQHGDENCPVCGTSGALDGSWDERTRAEAERLRGEAEEADAAHLSVAEAVRSAHRSIVPPPPAVLGAAGGAGVDAAALSEAWKVWAAATDIDAPVALAAHLEEHFAVLARHASAVADAASAMLTDKEDVWRPLALRVSAWLDSARTAEAHMRPVKSVKAAEDWLKSVNADVRNERFAPIAVRAQEVWNELRQQSSVELGAIQLAGSGSQRRVTLDVTVDGREGAAISVMSQGELHALALTLFLPRATTPESPFRFVVIDDPVQAMDPAKVDGLARVFDEAGRDRQVVVFTHDDRLAESVRRLQIPARILSVTRRAGSVVEVREESSPAHRLIDDAMALANTDELEAKFVARIVPNYCRQAIEAVCHQVTRRRRLAAGAGHTEVEELLAAQQRLMPVVALALFDDEERAGDVLKALNSRFGPWAADVVRDCNRGSHDKATMPPKNLAESARRLVERLDQVST